MRIFSVLSLAIFLFAHVAFGGSISGTVINATSVEGMVLVIGAMHMGMTDLTSIPMTYVLMPTFPNEYTLTSDAIVDFNPYFPVAWMPRGFAPASGDPFGARLTPPTIPIRGSATGADITLFSSGAIGGTIRYPGGSFANVFVNVYDYYSFTTPRLESTHFVGRNNYFLPVIPSGPKRVQAFDDRNRNRTYDEGEPDGYYSIPFIGLDIVLVSGNISQSGIDITISLSDIEEDRDLPDNFSLEVHPNPFNSSVKISFFSDMSELASPLRIFDIAGRIIAEIPVERRENVIRERFDNDEKSMRCDRSVVWSPDKSLPSGIYFVKAQMVDGRTHKKPLVYLK